MCKMGFLVDWVPKETINKEKTSLSIQGGHFWAYFKLNTVSFILSFILKFNCPRATYHPRFLMKLSQRLHQLSPLIHHLI